MIMEDHKESKRTLAMHIPSFSPTAYDTSFKLFTSYIHCVYHYTKHGSCVTQHAFAWTLCDACDAQDNKINTL